MAQTKLKPVFLDINADEDIEAMKTRVYYRDMRMRKIKRFHRSMKNVVKLQHYFLPWELEQEIGRFIEYYPAGIPLGQPRALS